MFRTLGARAKNSFRLHAIRACGVALTLFALTLPAHADDGTDPFAFDASRWISFDHYKEKTKHGHAYTEETPAFTAPAAPVASTAPKAAPSAQSSNEPELAEPEKPLNPPLMPGVNKNFSLHVDSTADDTGPMAEITNLEKQPTVQLPAFSWQKAAQAAKEYKNNPDGSDANRPLTVRMSYLPEIAQPKDTPKPVLSPRVKAALEQHKTLPKKPDELSAQDKADLAALKAYKQEQLQALQNDRQTLKALQDAISQLGLQKDLNFMAGAQGGVANAPDNPSAPKMDFPDQPTK